MKICPDAAAHPVLDYKGYKVAKWQMYENDHDYKHKISLINNSFN